MNITYNSPGVLGRTECSAIPDNGQWVTTYDLTDFQKWDVIGNPKGLDVGYAFSRHVGTNGLTLYANSSSNSEVTIGQWLPYGYGDTLLIFLHSNFTILWISTARPIWYKMTDGASRLILREKPKITALNCMTMLKTANVAVNISTSDGSIQEYCLLDTTRNAAEAWDEIGAHYANETYYRVLGFPRYDNTVR